MPPATAIEAYLLFDEELAPISIAGVATTAIGVALALRAPRAVPLRADGADDARPPPS
ncbi:MAG: hypothetical protein ACR2JG_15520 [Geodermatophilaceae bacterium]